MIIFNYAGISGYDLDDKTCLSSTPSLKPVRKNPKSSDCYSLPLTKQKPCIEVNYCELIIIIQFSPGIVISELYIGGSVGLTQFL